MLAVCARNRAGDRPPLLPAPGDRHRHRAEQRPVWAVEVNLYPAAAAGAGDARLDAGDTMAEVEVLVGQRVAGICEADVQPGIRVRGRFGLHPLRRAEIRGT